MGKSQRQKQCGTGHGRTCGNYATIRSPVYGFVEGRRWKESIWQIDVKKYKFDNSDKNKP